MLQIDDASMEVEETPVTSTEDLIPSVAAEMEPEKEDIEQSADKEPEPVCSGQKSLKSCLLCFLLVQTCFRSCDPMLWAVTGV